MRPGTPWIRDPAGAEWRQQELAVTLLPSPRVMRGAIDACNQFLSTSKSLTANRFSY